MSNMEINLCGISFKNPVIAASGTFGFGFESSKYFDIGMLGGISVKGLTLEPKQGNPGPRIAETPSGILNSVGLQNPGVDAFINDYLPFLKQYDTRIIANIAGSYIDDYCKIADKLSDTSVDMIEMNVSCPNVKKGGMAFGTKPELVYEITKEVRKYCKKPMIVKLSPNTTDIRETAKAAEQGGADAVSLINTILGMAIDVHTRKPILANTVGGMSGPAVKPIALRMVWEAYNAVNIPVIGMGGIMTGEDAASFMIVGASAVQVGTANLIDPDACRKIINQLNDYVNENHICNISDLTGTLKL